MVGYELSVEDLEEVYVIERGWRVVECKKLMRICDTYIFRLVLLICVNKFSLFHGISIYFRSAQVLPITKKLQPMAMCWCLAIASNE